MLLSALIQRAIVFLKLKYEVELIIRTENAPGEPQAEYVAIYSDNEEFESHEITIWLDGLENQDRDFNAIVAHELIHAWQQERGLREIHGFAFRATAAKLELEFFPLLNGIYDPEIDER